MKTKIYLLALTSTLLNFAYAQQFTPQFTGLGAVGSTSPFHMVAVDENIIWASSSSSGLGKFDNVPNIITHTEDGGITWETHTLPVDDPNDFYVACISAVGPDSVWVSSIDRVSNFPNWDPEIYATFDGGNTWQTQIVPFSDIEAYGGQIHFFDHTEGLIFAASADGYFHVFKTYDGGNNWVRIPEENFPPIITNFEAEIDNGYYAIQDTFWVSTNQGRILKSTDRGTMWTAFDTPVPFSSIFEVTFSDSQYGVARYTNNLDWNTRNLIVTTDGGETWETVTPLGLGNNIFDLNSVPGKRGEYLCTSYSSSAVAFIKLFYSSDNGATWVVLNQVNFPGRIALFNAEIGWISEIDSNTSDIDVYKLEGTITKNEEVIIQGISIYPNPFEEKLLIDNSYGNKFESMTIFDCLGRKVYSKTIDSSTQTHIENLGVLSQGIYFLNIEFEKGLFSGKIIKQ